MPGACYSTNSVHCVITRLHELQLKDVYTKKQFLSTLSSRTLLDFYLILPISTNSPAASGIAA